jgi:hypothetical protein
MFLLYRDGYPDPFIPYQTIQPGRPIASLKPYDCQTEQFPEHIKMRVCRITVEEDTPFSAILVWTFDGAIQKVTYYGDTLQVVDLIRHFGKPDSVTLYNQHYVLNWNDGTHAVTPISTRRFAHQMSVLFVTLST